MSPYLIGGLFGSAFIVAAVSLVASIAPQWPRFRALFSGGESA